MFLGLTPDVFVNFFLTFSIIFDDDLPQNVLHISGLYVQLAQNHWYLIKVYIIVLGIGYFVPIMATFVAN